MSSVLSCCAHTVSAQVGVAATTSLRTLAVIPTYNEAVNVRAVIDHVLRAVDGMHILIVDDHSPDGTGHIAEAIADNNPRVHVLHRRGPRGLGAAYMAGFRWALREGYDRIIQMDADLSHDPAVIPALLKNADHHDLVIGSRYCPGGQTIGWPRSRQWLSFSANLYARTWLGSRIRDLTSGFRCWRRELLERIDFAMLRCDGYAFQVEMGHLAERAGARIKELPITFRERRDGTSKMTPEVARRAAWHTAGLGVDRLLGRKHPALLPPKSAAPQKPRIMHPRNVLVMCLGGIGDTVLSFAMLRQLRQRLPEARLTALVMWPQAAELVEDLHIFDEIIQHNFQQDRGWRSMSTLVQMHFRRFDVSILAYPTNRWEFKLASWIVHAKRRIGHRYENSGWLDNACWLLTDVVDQVVPTHNVDENLKLLQPIPGPRHTVVHSPKPDIRLGPLDESYHEWADRHLASMPGPYLGIHAGCSEFKNMADRRWPAERFAELCRLASGQLGLTPLLFGSGNELRLNEQIVKCAGSGHVVRTSTIRHTAAVIARCSVFVSNDSALAHIASATNVPTVMITGPTDAEMIRPYLNGKVLRSRVPCSPCYRPCRRSLQCGRAESYICVASVSVKAVFERVLVITSGIDRISLMHRTAQAGCRSVAVAENPVRIGNV